MTRLLIALLISAFAVMPVGADPGSARSSDPDASDPIEALQQVVLALGLARYARENDDASAMIVAARIMGGIRIATNGGASVVEEGTATQRAFPKGMAVDDMLAEAESMARGNRAQQAEIAMIRAMAHKGVLRSDFGSGVVSHARIIQPGHQWQFEIVAVPQRTVMVAAIGDGDADINLSVFDEHGTLTARDSAADTLAVVRWTPTNEARYLVEVTNAGVVDSYTVVLSD